MKEAEPGGNCPADDAPERLGAQACNEQACPTSNMSCAAPKQDVVLLVDTSGSLATGNLFDVVKDLTAELSKRFATKGSKVAVASFAGEPTRVAKWTTDGAALSKSVGSDLVFSKGPSLLAQGLSFADLLFKNGARQEAEWTAVVLTDGRVGDPFKAGLAAKRLQDAGARLVFVPLFYEESDDGRPTLLERLASAPARENIVVAVKDEASYAVDVRQTANEVVRGICSEVGEAD